MTRGEPGMGADVQGSQGWQVEREYVAEDHVGRDDCTCATCEERKSGMGAGCVDVVEVAERANWRYGWAIRPEDVVVSDRFDYLGRRMIYAGSRYVGCVDERRGRVLFNRESQS